MKERRRGKIVNVSSMTVPTAPPGFAHYISSKAAIVGLTRALARELGEHRICVNTLTPDYIAFDRDYDHRQPDMRSMLTTQRCFRREERPEDLLGTLLYLLGPGSDFVTGQEILDQRRARVQLRTSGESAFLPASNTIDGLRISWRRQGRDRTSCTSCGRSRYPCRRR